MEKARKRSIFEINHARPKLSDRIFELLEVKPSFLWVQLGDQIHLENAFNIKEPSHVIYDSHDNLYSSCWSELSLVEFMDRPENNWKNVNTNDLKVIGW